MPRKSKLSSKIDEKQLSNLFEKYEEELGTAGWRGNDSAWGKIAIELGFSNTERNRHICYNTQRNIFNRKSKLDHLLENRSVESSEEATVPTTAILSEAKQNIDYEQIDDASNQQVVIELDGSQIGRLQHENQSIFRDVNDHEIIDTDDTNKSIEMQPTESQVDGDIAMSTTIHKERLYSKSQFDKEYEIYFSHSSSDMINELMSDSDNVSPTGFANTKIKSDESFSSFSSAADNDVDQGNIIIGSNIDVSQPSKQSGTSGNKKTDYTEYPTETTTKPHVNFSPQTFSVETEYSPVEKRCIQIQTHANSLPNPEPDLVRNEDKGIETNNNVRQERVGPIDSEVSNEFSNGEIYSDGQDNDGRRSVSVDEGECYLS